MTSWSFVPIGWCPQAGWTALMWASTYGHLEVVHALVHGGRWRADGWQVDVNAKEKVGAAAWVGVLMTHWR